MNLVSMKKNYNEFSEYEEKWPPTTICAALHVYLQVVSASPVARTKKETETRLDRTSCNRTVGCGCIDSNYFRLSVSWFKVIQKTAENRLKLVATSLY
jgi:hypothetical protein